MKWYLFKKYYQKMNILIKQVKRKIWIEAMTGFLKIQIEFFFPFTCAIIIETMIRKIALRYCLLYFVKTQYGKLKEESFRENYFLGLKNIWIKQLFSHKTPGEKYFLFQSQGNIIYVITYLQNSKTINQCISTYAF